ncbi:MULTISPECIES: hypothetical protein [Streptomyces]|nr:MULTISPECIES: hypothetical protein [Streptomyces]
MQQAVADLAFEAGRQAAAPERTEHLTAITSGMEEILRRTATARL